MADQIYFASRFPSIATFTVGEWHRDEYFEDYAEVEVVYLDGSSATADAYFKYQNGIFEMTDLVNEVENN